MNREIKFRIWHKKGKEWCGILYPNQTISPYSLEYKEKDLIFCQFTGLKDSKGQEVFEGDIIKVGFGDYVGEVGKVVFKYGAYMLESKYRYVFQDTYKSINYGEVIGNIFENLELLKK